MRWIFLTLVVANLAALAWGLVVSSQVSAPSQSKHLRNPYGKYPEIVLLKEMQTGESPPAQAPKVVEEVAIGEGEKNESDIVALEAEPPVSDGVPIGELDRGGEELDISGLSGDGGEAIIVDKPLEQVVAENKAPILPMHDDKLLCELIGPFESDEVAKNFVERLKAIEVVSSLKDIELPAGPGYWVYLEPLNNRQEAIRMLRELQAKRIDSYVIPKGDLVNGISLGMFSKKALSDARVKEMSAIGLSPKVEEIERFYREVWVMLEPGEDSKMSSLSWERAMEGIKGLERRQNYCLDVASR